MKSVGYSGFGVGIDSFIWLLPPVKCLTCIFPPVSGQCTWWPVWRGLLLCGILRLSGGALRSHRACAAEADAGEAEAQAHPGARGRGRGHANRANRGLGKHN